MARKATMVGKADLEQERRAGNPRGGKALDLALISGRGEITSASNSDVMAAPQNFEHWVSKHPNLRLVVYPARQVLDPVQGAKSLPGLTCKFMQGEFVLAKDDQDYGIIRQAFETCRHFKRGTLVCVEDLAPGDYRRDRDNVGVSVRAALEKIGVYNKAQADKILELLGNAKGGNQETFIQNLLAELETERSKRQAAETVLAQKGLQSPPAPAAQESGPDAGAGGEGQDATIGQPPVVPSAKPGRRKGRPLPA